MSLLSRLESRFGHWAIPNVTVIIIAGQILLFFLQQARIGQGNALDKIHLLPGAVLQGEVWRLFTFLFTPPADRTILIIFYWILMYLFGSALEQSWGTFRYNMFLLVGYLASVVASFIAYALGYDFAASNGFLYGSIFLAFARIFPDYTLLLFFILPMKVKWLALLMWISYGYGLLKGDWMDRMLIIASVLNYLLFLGGEHVREWKHGHRRRSFQAKTKAAAQALVHQCLVCGLDSETSPKTLFRYCSKCEGQCCYCPEHIRNHEHVTS
ncbi:MAG: hypothetical protein ACR2NM_06335 [Bythopirellula sp.]